MSAETERLQAIRQALALGHYDDLRGVVSCRPTVETLLAALDKAEARSTALQTALAQTTNGALYQVDAGTGALRWHCRLCGGKSHDPKRTLHHEPWCPVQVLAESYREK